MAYEYNLVAIQKKKQSEMTSPAKFENLMVLPIYKSLGFAVLKCILAQR